MPQKNLFRLTLISLGIALLLAALFFDKGTVVTGHPQVEATPTLDRLAKPTLPASPSQADHGAQVYWLSCMPCHGERGQGLTDEFRQTYPPEDRNCWNSGCHGKRTYANGFTLPPTIPALIGPGTLQKFSTASSLRGFIFAAMPFWKPGSLTEQESWEVTAFILRQNGLWDARTELNASNADQITVHAPGATPTPQQTSASPVSSSVWIALIVVGVVILLLIVQRWLKRKKMMS